MAKKGQFSGEKHWKWKGGISIGDNRDSYNKKWRKENKVNVNWTDRKSRFKTKFGVSGNFLEELYLKQNFKCAICSTHEKEFTKKFAVDHNHKTGKIRGLLCLKCNTGIGLFLEDKNLLQNAIDYLQGGF